jgi:hypothetical protein
MQRGDARAFRISVAEVVQAFVQSPVSDATIGQWMAVHVQVGNRTIPTPALYTTSGHVYHTVRHESHQQLLPAIAFPK